jgi:hypothetical protein
MVVMMVVMVVLVVVVVKVVMMIMIMIMMMMIMIMMIMTMMMNAILQQGLPVTCIVQVHVKRHIGVEPPRMKRYKSLRHEVDDVGLKLMEEEELISSHNNHVSPAQARQHCTEC